MVLHRAATLHRGRRQHSALFSPRETINLDRPLNPRKIFGLRGAWRARDFLKRAKKALARRSVSRTDGPRPSFSRLKENSFRKSQVEIRVIGVICGSFSARIRHGPHDPESSHPFDGRWFRRGSMLQEFTMSNKSEGKVVVITVK